MGLCPQVGILMNYENEIVGSLIKANQPQLCMEAKEMGIIPQDVNRNIECLDDQVPPARAMRYISTDARLQKFTK